jgi:YbbR domain-containing protein
MEAKQRARKNLLKIVSLLFSFLLWIYVLGTADTQLDKTVAIRFILPQDKAVADENVKSVVYSLSGPRAFIRTIQEREDIITIDLTKKRRRYRGRYEVILKPSDISLPFGVKVQKIEPKKIFVGLDKAVSKELVVVPKIQGNIAESHKLVTSKVSPGRLKMRGPKSVMSGIDTISTMPIDLSGLSGEGNKMVGVLIPDERLSFEDDSEVQYLYDIRPTRANLVLKDIPVKFLASQIIRKSTRRKVSLIVLSDSGELKDIDKEKISVIAEIPEKVRGKVEVELKASLPDGLHLLEIQPQKIFVYVK